MLKDEPLEYIQEQYEEKNMVLDQFGEEVSPWTLYEAVYGDLDTMVPIVIIDEDQAKHIVKMTIDEAIDQCADRNDMLLGGSTYFKEYVSKATAKDIRSFIIDMDNVYSGTLLNALQDDWRTANGDEIPMPTYIVNSGTGLHLYYVLSEPIPHYSCNAEAIDQLYRRLAVQNTTRRVYLKKEVQWFGQDFRMAGGLNKYGWKNTVFKVGDTWEIDKLGRAVGLEDVHFVHYGEPRTKPPVQRDRTKNRTKRTGWRCNRAFYDYTLDRCREETREGNRYMSMCALSAIAWKCNVPADEVERDLLGLIPRYNQNAVRQMKPEEVKSALKMYNDKAMLTQRERLQDWIGWEYRPQRRNGRKRSIHLALARGNKAVLKELGEMKPEGRPTKKDQVAAYRKKHPEATPTAVARALGVSRTTVYRWWDA